jgi:hypothetical protein
MSTLHIHRKPRKIYVTAAVLLFILEVVIERYVHDAFVRPYLGDFLVVLLLYASLLSVSQLKVFTAAILSLFCSYAIEITQYIHLITVLGLEDNKPARIILGTSFSWWDLWMYTLGILFVLVLEKCCWKQV